MNAKTSNNWKRKNMNNKFEELTMDMTRAVSRHAALKKLDSSIATLALACSLALPTAASAAILGPLIELSRPNAVGTCDDHFVTLPATSMSLNDAFEPIMAVNPVNPKNIVVV